VAACGAVPARPVAGVEHRPAAATAAADRTIPRPAAAQQERRDGPQPRPAAPERAAYPHRRAAQPRAPGEPAHRRAGSVALRAGEPSAQGAAPIARLRRQPPPGMKTTARGRDISAN
jgi:hypothetical protein